MANKNKNKPAIAGTFVGRLHLLFMDARRLLALDTVNKISFATVATLAFAMHSLVKCYAA